MTEKKGEIRIACQGADTLPVEKFQEFQGKIKTLSEVAYAKLKARILELGFSEPISVWKNGGKNLILNGHQRIRTVTQMKEEGYACPKLPVNWVEAKSEKEALRKVLALTSQFGEFDYDGIEEFAARAELDLEQIENDFALAGIKLTFDRDEKLPNSDVEGDVVGEGDYLVVSLDDLLEAQEARAKVGLKPTERTISWKTLLERLGGV